MVQYAPATTLDDIYKNLTPEPLVNPGEFEAFYRKEVNEVRGDDRIARIRLGLQRAHRAQHFYKSCLMGHHGVGKSTEITRLLRETSTLYEAIRFSVVEDLDPNNFQPLDVVYLMMAKLVEKAGEVMGKRPSEQRLREILQWFAEETATTKSEREATLEVEAGAGLDAESLWSKVLNFFASLKSKLKFGSTQTKEVKEYRFRRLDELIELLNRLLDECEELLRTTQGRSWLFVGEDFDRDSITPAQVESLFVHYGAIFTNTRVSLVFTLPVALYYSESGVRLPFSSSDSFLIPDTPVFQHDHTPNPVGIQAVQKVLTARVALNLFDPGQCERLILASGGNLRDLFALVNYAADSALLRSGQTVNEHDVQGALNNLRSEYERRLGQSPFDREEVSYDQKVQCLLKIYAGEKIDQIPNRALYALLRARAVQEFNGNRWFGVHPLVVNILGEQDQLNHINGQVPGGAY
ncbi:hypothetical protein [Anthocerotibacter panamensis]|uniref:hypothetical protein n=1 Tax=Anthocerotibacter panamensis TaxID=2857077 RepID=UPI001C405765|nr:hypothetical protein [Anthocerotibacter panamensis]